MMLATKLRAVTTYVVRAYYNRYQARATKIQHEIKLFRDAIHQHQRQRKKVFHDVPNRP